MSKQKHYDVIHSEWITVKAKSEKEAYKKAEKTITKMIAEGSAPDFEDGLHDMFISDVREEEEVYCMDCGYVYTPRNYLGKSRCIKCGSEDYASKDWECTHQHCSERCTIGDIEEVSDEC